MPNQFVEMPHLLRVAAVRVSDASGYRRTARMIHVVYDVYRATDGDGLIACGGRIGFHLLQVFSEGVWHFDREDDPLPAAMGLPATMDEDVDVADELHGRWIEGRPGPTGPDGFNPLMEARPITPPPTPPAVRGATASPPAPAPGASPVGPAGRLAVVAADGRPSPGPLDHGPREPAASLLGNHLLSEQFLFAGAALYGSIMAELDRLPGRVAERLRPAPPPVASAAPDMPRGLASAAAERAYRAYRRAEEHQGRPLTDKEAYAWVREYDESYEELPTREAWCRALRRARRHHGDQKHRPVAGRTGRSVFRLSEL